MYFTNNNNNISHLHHFSDPASPKAEYDLAAYLGQATGSKTACARRYAQCPMDRKTISQALAKMARIQQ